MPRFRRTASKLDMYRKVPTDLLEGTKRGSVLSVIALFTILALFWMETRAFFRRQLVTDLALDTSGDPRLRLNFNITMLDLRCEWAVVDVVSSLGTDQNISAHVSKHAIDVEGKRRMYKGRNRNQKDIDLKDETVTQTIEELHANGEDAISLDPETFEYAKRENDYLFVDFYASWCSHCRDFAPTWEAMAELMLDAGERLGRRHEEYSESDYERAKEVQVPVMIAKIDCVTHHDLCVSQEIRAYPTLRLYVDGQLWKGGDYRQSRNLMAMTEYLFMVEEDHKSNMDEEERTLRVAHEAARERLLSGEDGRENEKEWYEKITRERHEMKHKWNEEDHPGCQLSGYVLLERVPGNFHVQARSLNQEFAPHMTNVSHMVNSITVGDPTAKSMVQQGRAPSFMPRAVGEKISPMDGNVYVTHNLHEAYHHYLKLVSTSVDGFRIGRRDLRIYQIIENSQLAYYRNDMIPEAKFSYDLSPIAVSYHTSSRHWYDYCTSIMAIVGGVFTVVGMLESSIQSTVQQIHRRSQWKR